jgi:ABC-type Mn2+/Zn2+ transport system permease subunit
LQWDTPAGPSIVLAASLLFAASLLLPKRLAG